MCGAQYSDSNLSHSFYSAIKTLSNSANQELLKTRQKLKISKKLVNETLNLYKEERLLVSQVLQNLSSMQKHKISMLSKIFSMFSSTPYLWILAALENLVEKDLKSTEFPVFARASAPFLPESVSEKPTLVLDLDETLIHKKDEEFLVRPDAEDFLKQAKEFYEIVIFTASTPFYADEALKKIDPNGDVKLRLYRNHMKSDSLGWYKDIGLLGRSIERVTIVDNLAENFRYHQNNGICIESWLGNPEDKELGVLLKGLRKKHGEL